MLLNPGCGEVVGVGVGCGSGLVRPQTRGVLAETPKRFSAWPLKQYCLFESSPVNRWEVVLAPRLALGLLSPDPS